MPDAAADGGAAASAATAADRSSMEHLRPVVPPGWVAMMCVICDTWLNGQSQLDHHNKLNKHQKLLTMHRRLRLVEDLNNYFAEVRVSACVGEVESGSQAVDAKG